MSVERNLQPVRERRQAIIAGDAGKIAQQKQQNKLTARERVEKLLDPKSFTELDALKKDTGVVSGMGTINGNPVYVFAQDVTNEGGAMCARQADKINKVQALAVKTGSPVVGIFDSVGAELSEGVGALDAYARVAAKTAEISGVVPQIALVLGECGGTASAVAQMNDIVIMTNEASLFMNGAQVISAVGGKQVTLEEIAGGEASMKSGAAQMVAENDEKAIELAKSILNMLPQNNLDEAIFDSADSLNRTLDDFNAIDKIEDVTCLIKAIADNGEFVELYQNFAASMVTGLIKIGGYTVGVVANQPNKDNGRLTVYGCKKAAYMVSFCDSFSIPVITLVDSMGIKVNTNPQGELIRAVAQLTYTMASATTAKISLITGQAIGAGYTSMASRPVNDLVYVWPGSVVSSIPAKIAVQLTKGDELNKADDPAAKRAELEAQVEDNELSGLIACENGFADDVIEPSETRKMLYNAVQFILAKREERPAKKHGNMPL